MTRERRTSALEGVLTGFVYPDRSGPFPAPSRASGCHTTGAYAKYVARRNAAVDSRD